MSPDYRWTKVCARRISFGSLFKVTYLCCVGMMVCLFMGVALVAVVAPDRVSVAPGYGGWSLVASLLLALTVWPPVVALLLAAGGTLAFAIVGRFVGTDLVLFTRVTVDERREGDAG